MDEQGDDRFKKVEWFSMSFHLLINSLCNTYWKLCRVTFLLVYGRWQTTYQCLDWALNFPDPEDIVNDNFHQFKVRMTRNYCNKASIDKGLREIQKNFTLWAKEYAIYMQYLILLKWSNALLMDATWKIINAYFKN